MGFDGTRAALQNLFNATPLEIEVDAIVMVGHREPHDALYQSLLTAGADTDMPSIHPGGCPCPRRHRARCAQWAQLCPRARGTRYPLFTR